MVNVIRNHRISRRTVLRGAGAALALPLLDAMLSRSLAKPVETEPPRRMAVLWMPNGVHPDQWTPEQTGREFQLSPTLQPLADHRQDLLVLTNLWHQNSDTGDGHYVKCSGFLTGTTIHKTVGVDLNANGVSMDQVVAGKIGHLTPLPSLELGTEAVRTGVDKAVGYTRVYGAHIAWKSPTVPLAKEINPRFAFERLVRASSRDADSAAKAKSTLDLVLEDARQIQRSLGQADSRKIDEYLESVRSIESRLERLDGGQQNVWQPRAQIDLSQKPDGMPEEHAERVKLMLDIIAMAFQTDTTRVSTFMFGNSVSDISFSFLDGVEGAHHSMSHHEKDVDKMRQYQLINQWHVAKYAYLIDRLKSMTEADSTVFDNSTLLLGSGLRDGNSHNPHDLPILLAGGCGGRIQTGQHLVYEKDSPLSNLFLCMLNAMGTPVEKFADSTEPLKGVLQSA